MSSSATGAKPVYPKNLEWQDDGARASLSKSDAKRLYDYLVDVDAYLQGL